MSGNLQYISASRRCDLPRFAYGLFFEAWRRGQITYNGGWGRSYTVSLRPDDVCGFIFWSKDYRVFIEQPDFHRLIRTTNAIFHFTINDCTELEPNLPPVGQRLETLKRLCGIVGPERVLWRFDPICRYVDGGGRAVSTDGAFFSLLSQITRCGITRCIFSFMTDYAKLRNRPVRFEPIGTEQRVAIASRMLEAAQAEGVLLSNCCNTEVPRRVPGVGPAHCVDEQMLRETDRFGAHRAVPPRPTREGCGCFESRDVGSYTPSCPHGCFYCYANPRVGP